MNHPLIHGENIFKPIAGMPEGKITRHKMFIAGHSETGHHHVLRSDVEFEVIEPENLGDSIFIRLLSPAQVTHQKTFEIHETKTLNPGVYEVFPALEYNPFTKVMQRQFD